MIKRAAFGIGLGALILFSLAPSLWTLLTSVKTNAEIFSRPLTYLPAAWSIENYSGMFEQRPFGLYIRSSLIVAAGSTLLALLLAAPAAYAIARFRMRGKRTFELGMLAFSMIPAAVLLAPLTSAARTLGLSNSYLALASIHAALNLPFAVWMLTAFFRQLPVELEEAGRIDGYTRLGVLRAIVLPLAAPALAATAILLFIFSWNEFVVSLILMTRDSTRTVPVGIAMLSGATAYEVPWGQISAAVVLTTFPVVAAVLAFQRRIIQGLTAGAVKG
ncbi:MAG: hypothetical protein A3G34_02955 [Candidatus Lindowbacteria bacterium RIFCSPLOWO2_12_FULL_62_27]|nr:MAG: hypothetical protein A3G34_02955 [Candidatus Lindowbacteria bacterium RIFCSPLOWO2_12_FULL_62_27]